MKKHAEYVAAYRERQKANGRCRQCPDPVVVRRDGKAYAVCESHRKADAERSARRHAARKAKPSE